MCGIAGIYQQKNKKADFEKFVARMNGLQEFRGPDDEGIFIDKKNGIALGHRRLSILDLSKAGHQPMVWRSKNKKSQSLAISFNGEIYNFLELKKDLEKKGYKFKTKTDTEIILALYDEYGEASFLKLRGMFAFALWDNRGEGKEKKLFLVKDRYGIKPLYYFSDSNKLVFASTVGAIAKSGLISLKNNPKAIISFLLFGSVALPLTTIKNVFGIPAGYYLVKDFNGRQKLVKYYDALPSFLNKSKVGFDEAQKKVSVLFDKSVEEHLISDAPLGVFLSGGLDSSAVAAIAAKKRQEPITTLSVIFDESEFSEEKYQDLVVQKIKSEHKKIKITKKDFFDSFSEIFETMDQPTVDGVNTFFVSKAAKEADLKVVLSGLGADEIFYGYPSFKKAKMLRQIQKLPKLLKMPLEFSSIFGDRYAKINYFAADDILSFYLGIRGLFAPSEVSKILNVSQAEIQLVLNEFLLAQFSEKLDNLPAADLLSYLEIKFYLQNQLLKDTDFMSMRHSLEVRVPFLDNNLVEYLSSLPDNLKISKKENKPLLAGAVRDLLPQEIFTRFKMGFTFPFEKWLREELGGNEFKLDNFIDKNLENKFKKGNLHWSRFWSMIVLNKFIK